MLRGLFYFEPKNQCWSSASDEDCYISISLVGFTNPRDQSLKGHPPVGGDFPADCQYRIPKQHRNAAL